MKVAKQATPAVTKVAPATAKKADAKPAKVVPARAKGPKVVYFTYKKNVRLAKGQTLHYKPGRGYYRA